MAGCWRRGTKPPSAAALPLTPEQWAAAWRGESIHSTVESSPSAASLYVLAPLRAAADAPVGALLVFRIDASQKLGALFDLTRKEARGETYALNRLGVLINPSRFEDDLRQSGRLATAQSAARTLRLTAPETPEQLTVAVATAVRGESGVRTAPYPNYRGEPVLGAWTWLADLDLGLVTEVDAAESLYVLHQQQQLLLLSALIADLEREQGQIVVDYSRDAGAEAATFATPAALLSLLPQVLASGAAVVVYPGHQLSDDEVRALIAQASSGAVHAQLRFVAERRFDAEGIRLSNVVSLAADPLIRSSLLLALGTAAGRASPALAQPKFFAASTAPRALESPDEAERNGRLILVAEENFTNQEVIRRQLGLLGYTSEMVENGEQALQELGHGRYACLLTDCHMPVMDGYALAPAVRARAQTSGTAIYIIAITANALQGEADRCREAGMDYYLSKPLDLRKLKHLLEGILPPPATPEDSPERPAFDAQVLRELIGDDPDSVRETLAASHHRRWRTFSKFKRRWQWEI